MEALIIEPQLPCLASAKELHVPLRRCGPSMPASQLCVLGKEPPNSIAASGQNGACGAREATKANFVEAPERDRRAG